MTRMAGWQRVKEELRERVRPFQTPLYMKCLFVVLSMNIDNGEISHVIVFMRERGLYQQHALKYRVWRKCDCVLEVDIFIVPGAIQAHIVIMDSIANCVTKCADKNTLRHQGWGTRDYGVFPFTRARDMIANLQHVDGDALEQRLWQLKAALDSSRTN